MTASLSISSSSSLSSLPRELIRKICKKSILSLEDVFSLISVSSSIRNITLHDDRLWHHLYKKKWMGYPQPKKKTTLTHTWRELFISTKRWKEGELETISTITAHTRGVTSLFLDDSHLFSGSHDTSIKVYCNESLKVIGSLEGHKYTIWALVSDGSYLYSGSNDQTIKVWDLETLTCKYTLHGHESKIFGLDIKDNLLFSSGDRIVKVWDRNQNKPVKTLEGHTGGVNAISVIGDHLITGSSDKSVKMWDLNTLTCQQTMSNESTILSLAADNRYIYTGHEGCMIKMWDTRSSTWVGTGTAHNWQVWQLAMAGGYLFAGSFDHKITMWDVRQTLGHVGTFVGHRSYIHALAPDNHRILSASADRSIRVWSSTTPVVAQLLPR